LVENGLNINHVSEDGRNILHFAINDSDSRADMNSQLEIFLIESGVNCNLIDKQGRTPLHYYFIKIGNQKDSSEIDPIEGVSSLCGSPGLLINV
jgi:ankyrin repeat protein